MPATHIWSHEKCPRKICPSVVIILHLIFLICGKKYSDAAFIHRPIEFCTGNLFCDKNTRFWCWKLKAVSIQQLNNMESSLFFSNSNKVIRHPKPSKQSSRWAWNAMHAPCWNAKPESKNELSLRIHAAVVIPRTSVQATQALSF